MDDINTTYMTFNFSTNQMSNEYPNEQDEQIQNIFHVFSMVVYAVAFVLGTSGNGLVIWIAGFKMKKTVNVVWFLNLAIADFIFTLFLPLSIAYIALGFHWPFGNFMCKLNSTLAYINLFASVFLLTVISIDRCISVVFPVWSQNHRTTWLASMIALGVWFLALCVSLSYFIFRDLSEYEGQIVCFNNFGYDENDELTDLGKLNQRVTVIIRFILGFLVPFTVIAFCYTVIALRLYKNNMSTSTKPFKIIVAVLISFFLCWFPYHVFSFLELSTDIDHRVLIIGVPITSSLAFLNSCVNPFLYVFMGRDFRTRFRSSIQSIFEKAFNEDSVQTDFKSKTKSTSESQMV